MSVKRSTYAQNLFSGNKKILGDITVMSHYHYHKDPNLGEGKCELIRISCAFIECTEQIEHEWIP